MTYMKKWRIMQAGNKIKEISSSQAPSGASSVRRRCMIGGSKIFCILALPTYTLRGTTSKPTAFSSAATVFASPKTTVTCWSGWRWAFPAGTGRGVQVHTLKQQPNTSSTDCKFADNRPHKVGQNKLFGLLWLTATRAKRTFNAICILTPKVWSPAICWGAFGKSTKCETMLEAAAGRGSFWRFNVGQVWLT